MPVSIALSSLGNSVILIKNGFGQMYVPAYNINQIGNMNPGEGYYLYVNATDTLFYPPNGAFKAVAGESTSPMPKHLFPDFIRTGNNASLILNINAMDGDEIGIYNTIGELIGSGIVQKGLAAITIWGDDKTTETIEGAVEGELLTAKLLDVETGVYTDILLTNIKDILTNCEFGKFYYSKNCLFTANTTLQPELTKELSISNIPNPFSGTTSVRYSIPDNGNVEINIFNLQGEQVSQLIKCQATSGTHELNFNSGNLSSGVYSLVMRFGSQEVTTMMMIVK
jgi:hypothetical protein